MLAPTPFLPGCLEGRNQSSLTVKRGKVFPLYCSAFSVNSNTCGAETIAALEEHLEPVATPEEESPVRNGHRYALQARLKKAGTAWLHDHAVLLPVSVRSRKKLAARTTPG